MIVPTGSLYLCITKNHQPMYLLAPSYIWTKSETSEAKKKLNVWYNLRLKDVQGTILLFVIGQLVYFLCICVNLTYI